jgi:hypothetical protein
MADPKNAKDKAKDEDNETPEARFVRVAGKRVSNALRVLDSISAAGKSSIMVNTPEQREKIVNALTAKVQEVAASLQTVKGTKRAPVETFQL